MSQCSTRLILKAGGDPVTNASFVRDAIRKSERQDAKWVSGLRGTESDLHRVGWFEFLMIFLGLVISTLEA